MSLIYVVIKKINHDIMIIIRENNLLLKKDNTIFYPYNIK